MLFAYKGYTYCPYEEQHDVHKIWHTVITPDGTSVNADFSPYAYLTQKTFENWVDLGCPGRIGITPLTDNDLRDLLLTKVMVGSQ